MAMNKKEEKKKTKKSKENGEPLIASAEMMS